MPGSLLARYESFLISNASAINTIESSLRSLSWFLPGRFKDAELASEALQASMNLMTLYHDTILARRLKTDAKLKPLIPPSPHSRYTHAWADKTSKYKYAARMLEVVKFLQLLLEMTLRKGFKVREKVLWRAIVSVEVVKAILKFVLLGTTRRPVLSPPIPEREIDPAMMVDMSPPSSGKSSPQNSPNSDPPEHLKNNKVQMPTPTSSPLLRATSQPYQQQQMIDEYLLPKALSPLDVKPSLSLVPPLTTIKDWTSEIIYILRPLVYVIFLARAANAPRKTSGPLIISLSMELLAHYLRRAPPPSSTLERSEYASRDRELLWYFMRGQVWTDFTRPKVQGFVDFTERIPLVNVIGAFLQEWIPLIDEYYYYTAT